MSRIMYAAPVTRIIVQWDAHLCHLEEEKLWHCLELFCPELSVQYLPSCSLTLRELEPVHWVTWSGSRFIMSGAVRLRAVRAALYELFVHSERIRAATQGVYILNLCRNHCNVLMLWNITYMCELIANSTLYLYTDESHFVTDSVPLNYLNVVEPPP